MTGDRMCRDTYSRKDASAMNTKPTMPVAMLNTITCSGRAQRDEHVRAGVHYVEGCVNGT